MMNFPDFKEKKIILFFSNEGDKIYFENDNLIIKDNENKIKCQYTCYKIFILFVIGGFEITSGIVERANRFGFSIIFMNYSFKVYATINNKMEGNTLLREKQYLNSNSDIIGKAIIINKIKNQSLKLKQIRNKDENLKKSIKNLEKYIEDLKSKQNLKSEEIMGIEGIASKQYFKVMFNNQKWIGRQPRVKRDEVNLLLDIGYTVLFNYIEAITNIYGFDIYKGVLHKEFYKRKSLICDLIEPFRPIIDYKIRKLYSLNQVNSKDFICENGRYRLDWKSNKKYMGYFIEEINRNKELIFSYIQMFYRWYMKGADVNNYPEILLEEK